MAQACIDGGFSRYFRPLALMKETSYLVRSPPGQRVAYQQTAIRGKSFLIDEFKGGKEYVNSFCD